LIVGSIEMDRFLLAYNAIGESARAGVRYAVVNGYYGNGSTACGTTTTDNIKSVVKTFAAMGMLDPNRVNTVVTYANCNVGSPVSIYVSYPYDPFTSFFPLTVNLASTANGTFAF
jgi:hypothetical protein